MNRLLHGRSDSAALFFLIVAPSRKHGQMADDVQQPEDGFPPLIPTESGTDLQRKLDRLIAHQEKVRRTAAFGGMTPGEAKEYEKRRMKISQLAERLLQQKATDDSAGRAQMCPS